MAQLGSREKLLLPLESAKSNSSTNLEQADYVAKLEHGFCMGHGAELVRHVFEPSLLLLNRSGHRLLEHEIAR